MARPPRSVSQPAYSDTIAATRAGPPGAPPLAGGARQSWVKHQCTHIVLQAYVRAVTAHPARLQRLEHELHEHVKAWRLSPVVEALQALRGVQCTVAVTTVAELGDLTRFDTPRALMKFLGVIPAEYSSGARRQQGAITKAGNTHARRVLVEGAWAYRSPATGSRHLQLRLESQPKILQDIRWKAQGRLWKRTRHTGQRGPRGHGPCACGMPVGHGPGDSRHPIRPKERSLLPDSCSRCPPGIGRDAASVLVSPSTACRDPLGIREPSVRQAPDGGQEGGTQPPESRRITRRFFLAPPLLMHDGQQHDADRKKVVLHP